jgi:hypothetical protein
MPDNVAWPMQNASIDAGATAAGDEAGDEAGEVGGRGAAAAAAALLQAACDLCAPLAPGSLLPPDQAHLVHFHLKASCSARAAERWRMRGGVLGSGRSPAP